MWGGKYLGSIPPEILSYRDCERGMSLTSSSYNFVIDTLIWLNPLPQCLFLFHFLYCLPFSAIVWKLPFTFLVITFFDISVRVNIVQSLFLGHADQLGNNMTFSINCYHTCFYRLLFLPSSQPDLNRHLRREGSQKFSGVSEVAGSTEETGWPEEGGWRAGGESSLRPTHRQVELWGTGKGQVMMEDVASDWKYLYSRLVILSPCTPGSGRD